MILGQEHKNKISWGEIWNVVAYSVLTQCQRMLLMELKYWCASTAKDLKVEK